MRQALPPTEENALWQAYKLDGDLTARDTLAKHYMHLVVQIAHLFHRNRQQLDDLISEGHLGLMLAIERFDTSRGVRFVTYASWWIKTLISKYIRVSQTILGKELVRSKDLYKLRRELRRAQSAVGESREEVGKVLSRRMSLPIRDVETLLSRLECYDVSLEAKMTNESASLIDSIAVDAGTPEACLEGKETALAHAGLVTEALSKLTPRERLIVERRFMEEDPTSLAELGRNLGFSRERARQLEVRAVIKLRKALEEKVLTLL